MDESESVPTWRVCRGSERGGKAWPCSRRCCSRSASGSEPWPRGSGSCRSTGYALQTKTRGADTTATWRLLRQTRTPIYHSVLVLLWGVVHGCVPSVGAAGVHFADVQHPVPSVTEIDMEDCCNCTKTSLILICDGSCTPPCSSRHLLCWSSEGHVVLLRRDRDVRVKSHSTGASHIRGCRNLLLPLRLKLCSRLSCVWHTFELEHPH